LERREGKRGKGKEGAVGIKRELEGREIAREGKVEEIKEGGLTITCQTRRGV
jgi:hypothetical protein